jgi:hypothetical protein
VPSASDHLQATLIQLIESEPVFQLETGGKQHNLFVRLDMAAFQRRLAEVKQNTPGEDKPNQTLAVTEEGWGHGGKQNSNDPSSPPDTADQDISGGGWVHVTAAARGASKTRSTTSPDTTPQPASQTWSKAPAKAGLSDAEAAHRAVMAVASLNSWETLQLATLAAVGLQMGGSSNKQKVDHTLEGALAVIR